MFGLGGLVHALLKPVEEAETLAGDAVKTVEDAATLNFKALAGDLLKDGLDVAGAVNPGAAIATEVATEVISKA